MWYSFIGALMRVAQEAVVHIAREAAVKGAEKLREAAKEKKEKKLEEEQRLDQILKGNTAEQEELIQKYTEFTSKKK